MPAYPELWSLHDHVNHHYRSYTRTTLGAAARGAGWRIDRMTSFNGLLLAPAAAVRLAQRRRQPSNDYRPDVKFAPGWLNSVLERPLQLEARWLSRGRTIPLGLSLMALLQ